MEDRSESMQPPLNQRKENPERKDKKDNKNQEVQESNKDISILFGDSPVKFPKENQIHN